MRLLFVMLIETLLAHPLLSQLPDIEENAANIIGHDIHKNLKAADEFYIIGAEELRLIFERLCDKQNEAYRNFLEFDYESLHHRDADDPFYISTVDVIGRIQLLNQIFVANKLGRRNIALTLLNELTAWIDANVNQIDDIFDLQSVQLISSISAYMPSRAFEKLSEVFTDDYVLSSNTCDSENYSTILEALSNLALTREYFEFSANTLLRFAAQEIKLGIYHADYQAGRYLSQLFIRSIDLMDVTFQERCNYIAQKIQHADEPRDYSQLYVLMLMLGYIADRMISIKPYSFLHETYVRFAVYQLLHYAGRNDDDGLGYAAEEQLHALLEESMYNSNTDISFIIFRYQNEYKRDWNTSHFNALSKLYEDIQDFKADKWMRSAHAAELRLQQLVSIEGEREFLSSNFTLFLGAKKPNKRCEITVDMDSNRSLHERQSLAERLIYSETMNLHKIQRGWPKTTYIIANVGIVITNKVHIKEGDHKRIFITVPIHLNELSITGRSVYRGDGHAEEALYAFLLTPSHFNVILDKMRVKLMVDSLAGHKVYAFVMDLHGTYDMCQSCSVKGIEFQNSFRDFITTQLHPIDIHLPRRFIRQIPVVFRYSSDISYHYPRETNSKKIGLRSVLEGEESRRDMDPIEPSDDLHYNPDRDIRHYSANLLVHGKSNWHSFWNKERRQTEAENPPIRLEKWTAFTTDSSMRFLSSSRRGLSYTHSDGTVELSQSPG